MRSSAVALLCAILIQACSGPDKPNIVGHWRAENYRVQGLGLPIGPELDISEKELSVSGTDIKVPVERVEFKGKEITLSFPLGVSLSFHVESANRMFVDLPLIGPIYYKKEPVNVAAAAPVPPRVAPSPTRMPASEVASIARPTNASNEGAAVIKAPTPPAATSEALGDPREVLLKSSRTSLARGNLDEAEQALAQLANLDARYPPMLVERAALSTARSDADAALRHLDSALQAGFRPVSAMESDPRLSVLRSDSRFKALAARYR